MVEFNAIVGPLGAVLACLAAALTWRITEAKRTSDQRAAEKMPSLVQAAAFAGDHAPRLIADAITDVGKCLCDKMDEAVLYSRECERNDRAFRHDIKEILSETNRHLSVIAKAARAREARAADDREGQNNG
jgi:hypothetical protein